MLYTTPPSNNLYAQKIIIIPQLLGDADETWILDLKTKGTVTKGDGDSDVTMSMSDGDFIDLFQGKLNSTSAFMQGKLKIEGNMMLAMKLEGLMGAMNKSKL